jgi:hypothetical protein
MVTDYSSGARRIQPHRRLAEQARIQIADHQDQIEPAELRRRCFAPTGFEGSSFKVRIRSASV